MNESVLRPIFNSLSPKLRDALIVIALNPGIRSNDLGTRLGKPSTAVSGMVQHLIETGIVARTGHGVVGITIPYLERFLSELENPSLRDRTQTEILEAYPHASL